MTLTQFEGMLTTTHERVVAAQAVLAEVERGLAAAERADASVRRARPYLRLAGVLAVGAAVAVGVALVVRAVRPADEEPVTGVDSFDI